MTSTSLAYNAPMNTAKIDPLALLAVEAEARAEAEKCPNPFSSMAGISYSNVVCRPATFSPTSSLGSESRHSTCASRPQANRRKPSFALKLHAMLQDKNCKSVITWLPAGQSFVILNRDMFVKKCLPAYFKETKFESFSRRLKRWGFQKLYMTGASQAVYSHDLFQRDRLDLCKLMKQGCSSHNISKFDHAENKTTEAEFTNLTRLTRNAQAKVKRTPKSQSKPFQLQTQKAPPMRPSEYMVNYEPEAYRPQPVPARMYLQPRCMSAYEYAQQAQAAAGCLIPMHVQGHPPINHAMYNGDMRSRPVKYPSHLDEDIMMCEEQLKVLLKLRALKERYHSRCR